MFKKYIPHIIILVVGFVIGILCRPNHIREVTKVVRDTTFVVDTHIIEKPVVVEKVSWKTERVLVSDTTRIHDTLYMNLGIEKKVYKGDEYYAEVSGYNPSLDRIEVYPKTTTIKETITQSVTKRNALALGLDMSYMNSVSIPIYLEYSYLLHKNVEFSAKVLYDLPTQNVGFGLGAKVGIGW